MKVLIIGLPQGFRQDEWLQLGIQSDVERDAAQHLGGESVEAEVQLLPRPSGPVTVGHVVDVCYSGIPESVGDPTAWLLGIIEDNIIAVADRHSGQAFSMNVPFYSMQ